MRPASTFAAAGAAVNGASVHVRWDSFGGVTLESVLGALIDAGAPPSAVQKQLDGLRGATISSTQAVLMATVLAEHLGIAVDD